MKLFLPIGIVTLTAAQLASAEPPKCERWEAPGTDCQLLGRPQGCVVTLRDKAAANALRYTSAAVFACKNYVKKVYGSGVKFKADPVNETTEDCYWDTDGDGDIDATDKNQKAEIFLKIQTPEDQCYCTPHGPYTGLTWNGNMPWGEMEMVTLFHVFPRELKKAILAKNVDEHAGIYVSDSSTDPNLVLQKSNYLDPDAAEIDHIIPRTDSKGCICGDPTPENAAVISRELNGMMSNLSPNADLDRAKLYEKYVTCSDPDTAKYQGGIEIPFPIPLEAADIDESLFDIDLDDGDPPPAKREATASDPQTAGCAVGGGGGALGLGLAFLLVRRRRRS